MAVSKPPVIGVGGSAKVILLFLVSEWRYDNSFSLMSIELCSCVTSVIN